MWPAQYLHAWIIAQLQHSRQCVLSHCSFDYNTPYIVTLGKGYIIPGMDRGLVGTCLFERRRITFPANLGYGQTGVGEKIPPNASLTFYIRMVKIVRVSAICCTV